MTDAEMIERYIDYVGDRDFFEELTMPEQVLYKCQIKETVGFTKFSLKVRLSEIIEQYLSKMTVK